MYARLQNLMQWRMSLLLAGRHEDLAREYLYPYPVYMAGRQQVLRSPCEMQVSLRRLQTMKQALGVTRMEARVRAIELPRKGRFRVWVSGSSFCAEGKLQGTSQFVHYCRETSEGIKTEMSDFPECRNDWISSEPRRALA